MKRFFLFALTLTLLISACSSIRGNSVSPEPATAGATEMPTSAPTTTTEPGPEPKTLIVFGAASLKSAFEEIGNAFEAANPGVTVKFNFAGSNALRTQIEQGAEADVFASANMKEMDALVSGNLVSADSAKVFLTNQLIVITPANNPAQLTKLEELTKEGLKIVLAAKEVPVGNYALQVLDKLDAAFGTGYKDKVIKNVVSYENDVKQVVAKVQLGEADAGIVYSSDSVAAPDLQKIEIPVENNVVAKYPLAAMSNAKQAELAQKFIEYVLSTEGQSSLQKWGFLPVK
jgi:molybdate transport system substrate-binding protein